MTTNVLFAGQQSDWSLFQPSLQAAFENAGLDVNLMDECTNPEQIDYLIYAPSGPIQNLRPYKNLKLVQSLWAGVENIVTNKTLTHPLARMVDPGMVEGMVEYVTGHTLRHHLGTDRFANAQPGDWPNKAAPPLARQRRVGILGLGALGLACANALYQLNFDVFGWSRSEKQGQAFPCFYGAGGLDKVLSTSEILITLLPDTRQTRELINEATIEKLTLGASLINPGRGSLIDETALVRALRSGQISQATLDVFQTEPLPTDHALWRLPNVLITPHVASETRPETASITVAENIRRGEMGEPFLHLVNRELGY